MQRAKKNLNTIYISERIRERMRLISECALTAVVAPMGYGKTTAINWFLNECGKKEGVKVVRISIYSDNLAIFWKSVQDGFAFAGIDFLNDYALPEDEAGAAVLSDELCHVLNDGRKYYIFFDDFHLLADGRVTQFFGRLVNKLTQNVHLIVASRARFLEYGEIMRMGRRLHQITADDLRLNYAELAVYARRCGIALTEQQMHELLRSTEGWFSAIYLNLRSVAEKGVLADADSDIYEMFTQAMIEPLSAPEQEFLAVMGLADEFTAEMAEFVSKNKETRQILTALSEQNAFVSRLSDGKNYRFHHMMKECSTKLFLRLAKDKQQEYWRRYGQWYETHARYLRALKAYDNALCYDELLGVIEKDAGILLSEMKPQELLHSLEKCPQAVLVEHPLAILVLMRRLFTWREIPKMLELKNILQETVRLHPSWSEQERGNLLGECDLIMSFLMYNDIIEMSRLHQSASARMNRPAVTIRADGSWTFGSPSVLMMYYRAPGELEKEMAEMYECMPHYYKITNGHGQGAELVMDAEAAFNQGRLTDAAIFLERARTRVIEHNQENMALCCDFLSSRMAVGTEQRIYDFKIRHEELLKTHNMVLLNMLDSIAAYYYAILGLPEAVPEVFREHRLKGINYFAPGKPMMELIENQVYLAQGEYAKIIGRYESLKKVCDNMHYALVSIHLKIQAAGAYFMMKKAAEAEKLLAEALSEAEPDGFIMPFVENYRYIREIIRIFSLKNASRLLDLIMENGEKYETNRAFLQNNAARPQAVAMLSDKELELAYLLAGRMSNKEIAEKLYLSEGTVKQYANQIYAKLGLNGDSRSKRKKLPEILEMK